jgi:hypothetical protein
MCLDRLSVNVLQQERHRIDVDCRRTDRSQPLFSSPTSTPGLSASNSEKQSQQNYSTFAPNMSDIGAQSPSNEHIDRLAGILLTYNFYEKDLGMPLHLVTFLVTNSY